MYMFELYTCVCECLIFCGCVFVVRLCVVLLLYALSHMKQRIFNLFFTLQELVAREKLREKKGARGKAIKLEKRLIKEGKLAPKTGGQAAAGAKKKDKKKADE